MSAAEEKDESAVPDQEEQPLLRFGKLPTEPLLAKDRSQAFRFLAYGKGTRCVVTDDLCMLLCVGRLAQVKVYARGWIHAHRRLANVVVARAQEPRLLQMVISLDRYGDDEDDYGEGEGDEGMAEDYDDEEYDIEFDENLPDETIDDFMDSVRADEYAEEDGPEMEDYMEGELHEDVDGDHDGDGDDEPPHLISPRTLSDAEYRVFEVVQAYGRGLGGQVSDEAPCANCGSTAHILMECSGPLSPEGPYMTGCPFHNTKEHGVDECPLLLLDASEMLVSLLHSTLVSERAGKPAFRSEKFPWTKAMLIGRAWGAACVEPFPWSTEFAAAQRAEQEAAPTDRSGESTPLVADPATENWEAVKAAIKAGKVPDPGDLTHWLPPADFDPRIVEGDDTYEFLGIEYRWPKREGPVVADASSDDEEEY